METIKSWSSWAYQGTIYAAKETWKAGGEAAGDFGTILSQIRANTSEIVVDMATTSWTNTTQAVSPDKVEIIIDESKSEAKNEADPKQAIFSVETYSNDTTPAIITPKDELEEKSAPSEAVNETNKS